MSYAPQPPGQPQMVFVQKKSNAWKWILGILGGLALLCGGCFAACSAGLIGGINKVVNDASKADASRSAENSKSCAGKTYPDQQPANDRCADAANSVTLNSVVVTANPLTKVQTDLCTDVSYTNSSSDTISFNEFDWKLQLPSGEILDAWDNSYAENPLGSGDLIAGGSKAGTICFRSTESGQHVLIYKPSFWDDSRGIWINTIS